MPGKPQKKGRGVAGAFLNRMQERTMRHDNRTGKDTPLEHLLLHQGVEEIKLPARPPRAAADVTATDPLRRKHAEDADDALVAHSDSAMAANDDLIPGGRYIDALNRQNDRAPHVTTMDSHGVQDLVREMGDHLSPAEAQSEFERQGGSNWNPADPFSADNPEVAKKLREQGLARKRKLQ